MHHGSRPFAGFNRGRGRRRQPESAEWAASATSAIWDDNVPAIAGWATPTSNWATPSLISDQNWSLQQTAPAEPEMDNPDDSIMVEDDEILKGCDGRWGQIRYNWVTKGIVPYREWKERTRPTDILSSLPEMVEILSRSWKHLQVAQQGDHEEEESEPPVPESVQRQRRRQYYRNRRRR